jgi:hypothetical protein
MPIAAARTDPAHGGLHVEDVKFRKMPSLRLKIREL